MKVRSSFAERALVSFGQAPRGRASKRIKRLLLARWPLLLPALVLTGIYLPVRAARAWSGPTADRPGAIHARSLATAVFNTFTVTNTNDSGPGSLRQALQDAGNNAGIDRVEFNIPGGPGVKTITLSSGLIIQNAPEIIDATTQPGWSGTPLIELNGNGSGGNGIFVSGGGSTIRGLIINRFGGNGIALQNNGNDIITGCYIGVDATGTLARPNGQNGILISGSATNIIGGLTSGERNLISGNGQNGIDIANGSSTNNLIIGNYIGTNAAGTAAIGNGASGIRTDAPLGQVGGSQPEARNIISGNTQTGITLFNSSAFSNRIQGNYIGTDVTGNVAIPNRIGIALGDQIAIRASSNDFIGTDGDGVNDATEGNLISGNTMHGIVILAGGTTNNRVSGNRIGTDAAGTTALPNGQNGILVSTGPSGNFIGTNRDGVSDDLERNLISGNLGNGVMLAESGTASNIVAGNYIGLDITGSSLLGNGGAGVAINSLARGNSILGNRIDGNGGLGIDLGIDGVTLNDPQDPDNGANDLQNYPTITAAYEGSTTIYFNLNSTPNSTFRIEFFSSPAADPSGFGEGRSFLGFMNVTTNGSGNVATNFVSPITTPAGQIVSATATAANGSTSEFSGAATVLPPTGTTTTVAGRVISASGAPLSGAIVTLIDHSGHASVSVTNPFGVFHFAGIEVGELAVLQARRKGFGFEPRLVMVNNEILDLELIGEPTEARPK